MGKRLLSLDEIIGHRSIINYFKGVIERDKLPPVMMLIGVPGIGKTSIAKIVAVEIAYKNSDLKKLEEAKRAVILEDNSTDAVKLYNMSNMKSTEAIENLRSDLVIGFSSSGRKCIVLDEAHGMPNDAQDSLLTSFENLPEHLHIIVCSTEIDSFRDAFLSRCIIRRMNNLSTSEMNIFLKNRIQENGLRFELSQSMVLALINLYTMREPRRAINLLDSFEQNSLIKSEEFESFMNINQAQQITKLVGYLYEGNVLMGLDFINEIELDWMFPSFLLEVLKVAEGGQSGVVSKDATLYINSVIQSYGVNNLLGFSVDVLSMRISRTKLAGYFLKWCTKTSHLSTPKRVAPESVNIDDIREMQNTLEETEQLTVATKKDELIPSLALLLNGSDIIEP